jgi:anti-sigma B factor antagonist
MKFEDRMDGEALIVKVIESRIVADVAPQFKEGIVAYIAKGNNTIVLDLSEVTFIDSSGLGALIGSLKAMGNNGELLLASVHETVSTMFKLTRMDKIFRIFDTPEDAVASLS